MKNKIIVSIVIGGTLGFLIAQMSPGFEGKMTMKIDGNGYPFVQTIEEVCAVYPKTVQEIKDRSTQVQEKALMLLDEICACSADEQSKATMLIPFDVVTASLSVESGALELVKSVHPDDAMIKAAEQESLALSNFITDHIDGNVDLYHAFKTYAEGNAKTEILTSQERYMLDELVKSFEQEGLGLPEENRARVIALKKQYSELEMLYDGNINGDSSFIVVSKEGLVGIPEDFVATLPEVDSGYKLVMNYPVQTMVMSYCSVEATRKAYYKAFNNKAYPANESVLADIIALRHQIAQELGFETYAHYNLADKMVDHPQKAWDFENVIQARSLKKAQEEFAIFTKDLPEGVTLTADGKLKPWDAAYVSTLFKKKNYSIDEIQFAEYFPMEKTVAGLISIYEQFFNLTITEVPVKNMWHSDVQLLKLCKKDSDDAIGYVFLDMFPRDKKYGHAAQFSGVDGLIVSESVRYPAVATVVCNFTKPTVDKPSLLRYQEVNTFFHEFGHAIHTVLGARELSCHSGTKTERDFVELPSQMLENWMEEKEILTLLSSHFKTGKPLPDDLIEKRLELLKFGTGMFTQRQLGFGMMALTFFGPQTGKTVAQEAKRLSQLTRPYLAYDDEDNFYCAFGHLTGYGACYYGYLWSLALACDVFETIKQQGLLNPEAGKKYADAILSKGGSCSADDMMRDYLGREPNFDAFYKKMGF